MGERGKARKTPGNQYLVGQDISLRKKISPVRKKAQRYEAALLGTRKRTSTPKRKAGPGGQGRPPSPLQEAKQEKVTSYFVRKSPKAEKAR